MAKHDLFHPKKIVVDTYLGPVDELDL